MKHYSRTPNVYEVLARELRRRGVNADATQLEYRSAALRERKRLDAKADLEHLKNIAIAVKRARRFAAVAQGLWEMSPSSSNRRVLLEAQRSRSEARAALREECLQDQTLFDDVMRSVS